MNKHRVGLIVNLSLVVLAAALISLHFSYRHYTLHANGNWKSTKVTLEKGVWGAWATMLTKPALHQNRLNITCWHGMQEFTYKQPVPATSIQFEFNNSGKPFAFYINKTDTVSTGVLFQPRGTDSCHWFAVDAAGQFLSIQSYPLAGNVLRGRNQARVELADGFVSMSVNKQLIIPPQAFTTAPISPGFRGGNETNTILIDNIVMTDAAGKTLVDEQFSPPFNWYLGSTIYLLLASVLVLYSFRKRQIYGVTLVNMLTVLLVGIYHLFYFYHLSALYPSSSGEVNWEEIQGNIETAEQVQQRIQTDYPLAEYQATPSVILFLGSSQTWGAGASSAQKTITARVQRALDDSLDANYTVINGAISGAVSTELWEIYQTRWSQYKPKLVVINLSYNDNDSTVFRNTIRQFLRYNKSQNIKTLLIEEPAFASADLLTKHHQILRSEALAAGIHSIDMQQAISTYNDRGFLWWNGIHLTDYGQQKFADHLMPYMLDCLDDEKEK